MTARQGAPYSYTRLADALDPALYSEGKLLNLWGVVVECTQVKSTRGSGAQERRRAHPGLAPSHQPRPDSFVTLLLEDHTTEAAPAQGRRGLEVVMFGSAASLPQLAASGDFMRLHRVKARQLGSWLGGGRRAACARRGRRGEGPSAR